VPLSPPLLVSGLVLGLDAIACQLLALTWVLYWWIPELSPLGSGFAEALVGASTVVALWCPAAAALVLGVRSRAARLTGLATAAVVAFAAAAFAADGLGNGDGPGVQLISGLVVMVVNVGVVALLLTPAPAVPGEPPAAEPPRVIDLDLAGPGPAAGRP
jgi:hypothetical protein